jgi:hypothetical protein
MSRVIPNVHDRGDIGVLLSRFLRRWPRSHLASLLGSRSLSPFPLAIRGPSTKLPAWSASDSFASAATLACVGRDECRCSSRLGRRYRDREIIRSTTSACCRACTAVERRRRRRRSSSQGHTQQPLCPLPSDLEVHPRRSSPRPPRGRVGRQRRHLDRRRDRVWDERGEAGRVEPVCRRLDARSPSCSR